MKSRTHTLAILPLAAALCLVAACGQDAPAHEGATDDAPGTTASPTPADAQDVATGSSDGKSGTPSARQGEVIRFPHNATAVTLEGAVPAGADKRYTLEARAGQPARIALDASGAALAFNVYAPDSGPGGPTLFRGSREGARYSDTLPASGTYTIQLYRTGAQGDASAPYRLDVRVDPAREHTTLSGAPANDPERAITDYYGAIERGDYAAAYRQWSDDGRASGQSQAQFKAGFANTRHSDVVVGEPRDGEGAAGSVYITVPVTVNAVMTDGTRQRFAGSYILRRVNDVPGSSATARRWHIHSADLERAE